VYFVLICIGVLIGVRVAYWYYIREQVINAYNVGNEAKLTCSAGSLRNVF
jgi:hypothetical protein